MDVVHMGRFGSVKGLSTGVCLCLYAWLRVLWWQSFIPYLMMMMGGGGFNFSAQQRMSDHIFLCPHDCFESNWLFAPIGLHPKLALMDLVSIFASACTCVYLQQYLGHVWTNFIRTWHKNNT